MRKGYQILLAVTIAAVVLKLLYDWWNPHELVTFRGKDVAFGEALQAFSKQTRRTILFPANPGTNVDTKVTLDLRKVPLEDALDVVSDQTQMWHVRAFAVAPEAGQRRAIIERLSQDNEPPITLRMARSRRWQTAETNREPGKVTYSASSKDAKSVAAELNFATDSYFGVAGETKPITVSWNDTPVSEAVSQFASAWGASAERFYRFYSGGRFAFGDQERTRRTREERDADLDKLDPAERVVVEEHRKEQEERRNAWAAMTEDQRRDEMMKRFATRDREQQLIRQLKNTTPEQRAQRYQRMEARRQARGQGTPPPANPNPNPNPNPK